MSDNSTSSSKRNPMEIKLKNPKPNDFQILSKKANCTT